MIGRCETPAGNQPLAPTEALATVIAFQKPISDFNTSPDGVTIVTGAASGLGHALAVQLGPIRKRLILVDRDRVKLETVRQEIKHADIQVLDLTSDKEIQSFIDRLYGEESFVGEIYACAGIGFRGEHASIPVERHLDVLKVNLVARLHLVSALLPEMVRRNFGRIVLISSSSAFQPLPFMATYAASNAAVLSLAEAIAQETDNRQVAVMVGLSRWHANQFPAFCRGEAACRGKIDVA